ncbi:hypothetical protein C7M84_018123, partial [Penaeus vannamei]
VGAGPQPTRPRAGLGPGATEGSPSDGPAARTPKACPLSGREPERQGLPRGGGGPRPRPPPPPRPERAQGAGEPKPPARGRGPTSRMPRNARARPPTGPDGELARRPPARSRRRWFPPIVVGAGPQPTRPRAGLGPGATEGSPSDGPGSQDPQSLPRFRDGSRRGRGFLAAAGATPAPARRRPGPRGRRGQESPSRLPGGRGPTSRMPPQRPRKAPDRPRRACPPPASPQPPKLSARALSPHDRGQGSAPGATEGSPSDGPGSQDPQSLPRFSGTGAGEAGASSRRRGPRARRLRRPERAQGAGEPKPPARGARPNQQDAPAPAQGPRPAPTASLPPAASPQPPKVVSPYSCRRGPSAHTTAGRARPRGPRKAALRRPRQPGPPKACPASGREPERQGLLAAAGATRRLSARALSPHDRGQGSAPGATEGSPPTAPAARTPQSLPRFRGREPERQGLLAAAGGTPRAALSARALSPHDRGQGSAPGATEGSPSDGPGSQDPQSLPRFRDGSRRGRGFLAAAGARPRRRLRPAPAREGAGGRRAQAARPGGEAQPAGCPRTARARKAPDRPRRRACPPAASPQPPKVVPPIVVGAGPQPTRPRAGLGPGGHGRQPLRRPRQPGPPKPAPLSGTGAGEAGASTAAGGTPRPPAASALGPRGRRGQESPSRPPGGEAQPAGCPRTARARPDRPRRRASRPPASPQPPKVVPPYSCRRGPSAHTTAGRARPRGPRKAAPPTAPAARTPQSLPRFRDGSRRGRGFITAAGGAPAAPPPPAERAQGAESPSRQTGEWRALGGRAGSDGGRSSSSCGLEVGVAPCRPQPRQSPCRCRRRPSATHDRAQGPPLPVRPGQRPVGGAAGPRPNPTPPPSAREGARGRWGEAPANPCSKEDEAGRPGQGPPPSTREGAGGPKGQGKAQAVPWPAKEDVAERPRWAGRPPAQARRRHGGTDRVGDARPPPPPPHSRPRAALGSGGPRSQPRPAARFATRGPAPNRLSL